MCIKWMLLGAGLDRTILVNMIYCKKNVFLFEVRFEGYFVLDKMNMLYMRINLV